MSEFEAVHRAWHIDVGKHYPYVFTCLQNRNGLVGIGCFNSGVTGIIYEVDRVQSAEKLVFNY